MSGLEALAALGLACNIFQAISFGRETLTLIKGVYHNGAIDDSLMGKSNVMKAVAADIMAVEIPRPLGKHEQKLLDVMKKCTKVASDLQKEIALVEVMGHNAKGNLAATLRTAVKMSWRKRQLKRMEKDLTDSEQMMQNTLMAWIIKLVNTAKVNTDSLEESLRDFKTKYENGCRYASELVSEEARKTEVAIRDHVTQTSAEAEQRLEQRVDQARTEVLRKKLLGSLKYYAMNDRVNHIEEAHENTFQWLFADEAGLKEGDDEYDYKGKRHEIAWDSFNNWLQSDHNFYWIMGKPGSGKSSLAKFILSNPRTKVELGKWRHDAIVASHYFWRPGTLMQRNIKGMLCSIAHQLVLAIPNALQYASSKVDSLDLKDADTDWAVPELQHFCLGLIKHSSIPLCILIDGLDECGSKDDQQELLEILERFKSQNVKIIATSRDEPVFVKQFRGEPRLLVQDLTDSDLRSYATDKLHHEIQKDNFLVRDLTRAAEGVFLWLVLAVQSLNRGFANGDSATDIRKRMESLPKRLNDLYKDMWERLNDDADIYRKDAALYFRLVIAPHMHARWPMCMGEGFSIMDMMLASSEASHDAFAEAPMVSTSQLLEQCDRFQKNVEIRCAGLLVGRKVSIDLDYAHKGLGDTERALLYYAEKRGGFQFIHRSVRDFLIESIDGQNILRYEGMSSEHLELCALGAGLRAAELLHPILEKVRHHHTYDTTMYVNNELDLFLYDLSRRLDSRGGFVEALFSRCFELYSSSFLTLPVTGDYRYNGMRPARNAVFFAFAASLPDLDRYSIKLIQQRLVGRDIWSAILLAFLPNGSGTDDVAACEKDLFSRAQRLSSLTYKVDINLKSPLVALRPQATIGTSSATLTPDEIGPLDHIKASPFTRFLSFGLENLDWKPIRLIQDQPRMTRFLQLVCDFVSRGGDLRSTLLLACPDRWEQNSTPERLGEDAPHLLQMLGWDFFERCSFKDDDRVLCMIALEAATAIQRMLASLLATDHDSSEDNEHISTNETVRDSDLEAAVSFLVQRCEEHGRRPEGRVVGLLQPCGNFTDMPYRQVSPEDSVNLIEDIWACMHASEQWVRRDHLVAQLREVVARSPFSCIGFRDYLRDHGDFDEFAAHTLLRECEHGT